MFLPRGNRVLFQGGRCAAMEKPRSKIKLKNVLKTDRPAEIIQLPKVPESSISDRAGYGSSMHHRNGFLPVFSNKYKRKRAHKAGVRRDEPYKNSFPEDSASIAESYIEAEEKFTGIKKFRMKDDSIGHAGRNRVGVEGVNLAVSEVGSKESSQVKEGGIKVRFKTSRSINVSPSITENQEASTHDKSHGSPNLSYHSLNTYEENLKKPKITYSRSEMCQNDSGLASSKSAKSLPLCTRNLEALQATTFHIKRNGSTEISNSPRKRIASSDGNSTEESGQAFATENGKCSSFVSIKKELETSLLVIRKIMKMDAAEPFNVPVDPVALGIPDYLDIIDKPMDFGTICHELEKGNKYKTSEDVFRDVQLIWENCSKYNRKGDPILELMKRVKKNFAKYWTAAGLFYESQKRMAGKVDTSSNIKCDKDQNAEKLSVGELSSNCVNSNIGVSLDTVVVKGSDGTPSQTETACAREENKRKDSKNSDYETMEVAHSSEESELKVVANGSPQTDAIPKKKGFKFVLKKPTPPNEYILNRSTTMNAIQESINSGMNEENTGSLPDDREKSSHEQTAEHDIIFRTKSNRRNRNQRHKAGCLCAVCVVLRKKHAKAENTEHASKKICQTDNSEMSNEHGMQPEAETNEVQGQEASHDEREPIEGLQQKQESVEELHEKSVDHQESDGQKQNDTPQNLQDAQQAFFSSRALQPTSPEILRLCNVLFPRESHSLSKQKGFPGSRASSNNPFVSAIASLLK